MFTDQQKQEILDAALETAKAEIVKSATNDLKYNITQSMRRVVNDSVQEWFESEMKQELIAHLTGNKEMIIEASIEASKEMALALAKAMTNSLVEKVEDSWKRKKLVEALFS